MRTRLKHARVKHSNKAKQRNPHIVRKRGGGGKHEGKVAELIHAAELLSRPLSFVKGATQFTRDAQKDMYMQPDARLATE